MMERPPDEYYIALERRLRGLSPTIRSVMPAEVAHWYDEYVDVGEYGLAVEVVAERLEADARDSVTQLAQSLLPEAELMDLPEPLIVTLRRLSSAEA